MLTRAKEGEKGDRLSRIYTFAFKGVEERGKFEERYFMKDLFFFPPHFFIVYGIRVDLHETLLPSIDVDRRITYLRI